MGFDFSPVCDFPIESFYCFDDVIFFVYRFICTFIGHCTFNSVRNHPSRQEVFICVVML